MTRRNVVHVQRAVGEVGGDVRLDRLEPRGACAALLRDLAIAARGAEGQRDEIADVCEDSGAKLRRVVEGPPHVDRPEVAGEQPKRGTDLLDDAKAAREIERQYLAVALNAAKRELLAARMEKEEADRRAQKAERELATVLRNLDAAQKALDALGAEEKSVAPLEIRDDAGNRAVCLRR